MNTSSSHRFSPSYENRISIRTTNNPVLKFDEKKVAKAREMLKPFMCNPNIAIKVFEACRASETTHKNKSISYEVDEDTIFNEFITITANKWVEGKSGYFGGGNVPDLWFWGGMNPYEAVILVCYHAGKEWISDIFLDVWTTDIEDIHRTVLYPQEPSLCLVDAIYEDGDKDIEEIDG